MEGYELANLILKGIALGQHEQPSTMQCWAENRNACNIDVNGIIVDAYNFSSYDFGCATAITFNEINCTIRATTIIEDGGDLVNYKKVIEYINKCLEKQGKLAEYAKYMRLTYKLETQGECNMILQFRLAGAKQLDPNLLIEVGKAFMIELKTVINTIDYAINPANAKSIFGFYSKFSRLNALRQKFALMRMLG